jgi:hypothetical protein
MCCSSHGASITAALQLQAAALPTQSEREPTRLRYVGKTALSLRGPFSGKVYDLPASQAEIPVDLYDQPALLRTGLFEAL